MASAHKLEVKPLRRPASRVSAFLSLKYCVRTLYLSMGIAISYSTIPAGILSLKKIMIDRKILSMSRA
jgi:hypothetical protein